jgi:hypothetical protein
MQLARPDVRNIELSGTEAVNFLQRHIDRLRNLPAHGNRKLRIDQLFIALLLAFFNPIVRSQRLIEDCGDFNGHLDIDRLCRSTTSDALCVFDPERLKPIIDDLRARVPHLRHCDDSLHGITQRIIAGDGTYLTTLADVAWALHHTKRSGAKQAQVRANVQMDVQNWCVQVISVSGDDGSEPTAFTPDLLHDVLYVLDRNFLDFLFLNALLANGNNFVLRIRANAPAVNVVRMLPWNAADAEAGVLSDQIVTLTGRGAPQGKFRLVTIRTVNRKGQEETIRLLTSLIDEQITARVIGAIYRLRWQIELFFKWLKSWANLNHLLSTSRNGITFQLYVAVIAVLLMYTQLGRRVSRYALLQVQLLMHGQITLQQMMQTIQRREREKAMERARRAKKRAQKKLL